MRHRPTFAIAVLLSMVTLACADDDSGRGIEGSGNVVTESREVAGFDRILLTGVGTVLVTQDGTESLTIETDDNLMQYLTTAIDGGTLEISTAEAARTRTLEPTSGITYRVGVDDLAGLILAGAGEFRIDALETDRMLVELAGAGDVRITDLAASEVTTVIDGTGGVRLAGTTTSQEVTLGGTGEFAGADLASQQASVTLAGTGSIVVWVTETLTATLAGTGSIEYYGLPSVSENVTGTGSVNGRGDK